MSRVQAENRALAGRQEKLAPLVYARHTHTPTVTHLYIRAHEQVVPLKTWWTNADVHEQTLMYVNKR